MCGCVAMKRVAGFFFILSEVWRFLYLCATPTTPCEPRYGSEGCAARCGLKDGSKAEKVNAKVER